MQRLAIASTADRNGQACSEGLRRVIVALAILAALAVTAVIWKVAEEALGDPVIALLLLTVGMLPFAAPVSSLLSDRRRGR